MLLGAALAHADDARQHALSILEASPVIDGHNDLPWVLRNAADGNVELAVIENPSSIDTDIERLREGRVGSQFWSVYVPSSLEPDESVRVQLEQIDLVRRMIDANPDAFGLALSADDVERIESEGRIGSLLGIEGAHTFANSIAVMRSYFDLGVRYATLTHFHSTDWADSATGEARNGGLTDFGRDVVREMNRIGMIVDVAHVSEATFNDVLDVTSAPVIVSHTAARAVTDHPRNLGDDALRRITENGGVVMVYYIPIFVSEEARKWSAGLVPLLRDAKDDADWQRIMDAYVAENGEPARATLSDVADHIEHVARIAGYDHVGIGADFYGATADRERVQGLEDVSTYPELFAELIRRGWSDDNLRKLSRENILRVMRGVEAAAGPGPRHD